MSRPLMLKNRHLFLFLFESQKLFKNQEPRPLSKTRIQTSVRFKNQNQSETHKSGALARRCWNHLRSATCARCEPAVSSSWSRSGACRRFVGKAGSGRPEVSTFGSSLEVSKTTIGALCARYIGVGVDSGAVVWLIWWDYGCCSDCGCLR